jgi:hypothetical protein
MRAQIEQIVCVAVHDFPAKIRNRSIAAGESMTPSTSFSGNSLHLKCLRLMFHLLNNYYNSVTDNFGQRSKLKEK